MKKIGILSLVVVFVLGSLGVGYATWSDTLYINGHVSTGSVTVAFDKDELLTCVDNEDLLPVPKDIGWCEIYYDLDSYVQDSHTLKEGYTKLELVVHDAYPCYEVHFPTVVVHNIGTIPVHLVGLNIEDSSDELNWEWVTDPPSKPGDVAEGFFWKDFNANTVYDPDEEVINVTIVNFVCTQLEENDKTKGQVDLHFKEAMEECHEYSFQITLDAVQWNKK